MALNFSQTEFTRATSWMCTLISLPQILRLNKKKIEKKNVKQIKETKKQTMLTEKLKVCVHNFFLVLRWDLCLGLSAHLVPCFKLILGDFTTLLQGLYLTT